MKDTRLCLHVRHTHPPAPTPTPPTGTSSTPLTQTCTGNGGACGCGKTSEGKIISMNRYWGDENDEKVWGCGGGGAFHLTGADWNSQWGGTLSESGPVHPSVTFVGL